MAESEDRKLFRKKSLERLSSPERLDQLLEIVDRKSWLPLLALGLLILGVLAWSVLGSVPIHVEGKGILVRPRKVVEFQAPASGRLLRLEVRTEDRVKKGDVLAILERPDLQEQLRLLKHKHADLTAQDTRELVLSDGMTETLAPGVPRERTLRDHVEASRAAAQRLYRQKLKAIAEEDRQLDEQTKIATELNESLKARLATHRQFREERLVSKVELDEIQADYIESLERLAAIEAQRGALRTGRLQAEQELHDRSQRIAEWEFRLQQEIADVGRQIQELERQMGEQTHVYSQYDGRILEVSAAPGTYLAAAERLGSMEVDDSRSTLESVAFFRVKDGKRLNEGDAIRITPGTVERERHGSIEGVILSVSRFPVTLEAATRVVGNPLVAESLLQGGYLIEVSSRLRRSTSRPDRYQWTSSRGQDVRVSSGTLTTARVAIEWERPIDFVFPLIKSAAGVD